MNKSCFKLYADGSCRGNPGPSAAGMVIWDISDNEVFKGAVYLGDGTNNTAEYSAILEGLTVANNLKINEIDVYSDSELIVRQLNGEYKIKSDNLKQYKDRITKLIRNFEKVSFNHLKREHTGQPHKLAECLLKKNIS